MRSVHVRAQDGRAEIKIGDKSITVGRGDEETDEYFCPVDLVAAALGS